MTVAGILLAAGRGRRFDPSGASNKLLQALPGGEAVVAASARKLLSVLPKVIAVTPPADGGVGELLRGLGCDVTVCTDADSGMARSLVHAIRHSLPEASAWVIALGDMPHVQAATISALRDAIDNGAGIAAPVHGGKRGNPVAFSGMYLQALLALEGDQGARAILKANPVLEIEVDDPGILIDVDTAADL